MAAGNGFGVIRPRPACERCRGQRLRCSWDSQARRCQRCVRANTPCTIPRARGMGRLSHRQHATAVYFGIEHGEMYPTEESHDLSPGPTGRSEPAKVSELPGTPGCSLDSALRSESSHSPAPLSIETCHRNHANGNPETGHGMSSTAPHGSTSGSCVTKESYPEVKDMEKATSDERREYYVQSSTRLGQLNVELLQHQLYPDPSKPHAKRVGDSDSGSCSKLTDLKIGRLLCMTAEFRTLVSGFGARDSTTSAKDGNNASQSFPDRSTALMVMRCYTRLDIIYSRALSILHEMKNRGQPLKEDQLMPTLAIDGFSLACCHDLQLNFVIQLCEQSLEGIRGSMEQFREARAD